MLSYCLKCRKNTETNNPEFVNTKNRRITLLSKFVVSDCKESKFVKEEEDSGLSNNFGMQTPSIKTPLIYFLFCFKNIR